MYWQDVAPLKSLVVINSPYGLICSNIGLEKQRREVITTDSSVSTQFLNILKGYLHFGHLYHFRTLSQFPLKCSRIQSIWKTQSHCSFGLTIHQGRRLTSSPQMKFFWQRVQYGTTPLHICTSPGRTTQHTLSSSAETARKRWLRDGCSNFHIP